MKYRAKLLDDRGATLAEDVSAELASIDQGGITKWSGTLTFPASIPLETGAVVRLEFLDGRYADAIVTQQNLTRPGVAAISLTGGFRSK